MLRICIIGVIAILILSTINQAEGKQKKRENSREREKRILDKILDEKTYDRRIRPSPKDEYEPDGPTLVDINLKFRGISEISDKKMEYSTVLTFREEWYDDRLRFDSQNATIKYLTLNDPGKVWMPDLFFSNERQGHKHAMIIPNVYVRIFPTGMILYSIRISLTLSCPMNLKLFPLDNQTCSLQMGSWGWATTDLVFLWKKSNTTVQVAKNLRLPQFSLESFTTDSCNSKSPTGEYSCLKVDLAFQRKFSYYLLTIYIPCDMLVVVSWVSFWLDANAIPARVSLGVTTLLTMATQTTGINNSLPPVSYTKAIDVWTGVCLTFVFTALLEFALVNYASRSDAQLEKARKATQAQWEKDKKAALEQMAAEGLLDERNSFAMKPLISGNGMIGMEQGEVETQCCRPITWISTYTLRSKRIDVISRILFPLIFALFNVVYWSTYINAGGGENATT